MEARRLLEVLNIAGRLKDTTRHCYTSSGRHESVAEHSWKAALMAYFLKDEFPEADIDKVIKMCLIHDLGEAFTGDIPSFEKTKDDEKKEEELLDKWVASLPQEFAQEMRVLYEEMEKRQTLEARIYKAIDGLEAVIQHNESDIKTWLPMEYELNQTYAEDKVAFSDYLKELRQVIKEDTQRKIKAEKKELLLNLDRLHTTDLGAGRIKRNLSLETDDVVRWCRDRIESSEAIICREGKNWYITTESCIITVNASSYTIITAHKKKM